MNFAPIDGMTLAQLQQEFVDLGQLLSAIGVRRDCLLKAIGQKKADALARANVSTLNPEEKAALKAALE